MDIYICLYYVYLYLYLYVSTSNANTHPKHLHPNNPLPSIYQVAFKANMKLLNEVLDALIAQAVASAEKADLEDLTSGRCVCFFFAFVYGKNVRTRSNIYLPYTPRLNPNRPHHPYAL
jgi:hypothetical protein